MIGEIIFAILCLIAIAVVGTNEWKSGYKKGYEDATDGRGYMEWKE